MATERKIEGIYSSAGFHWVGDGFRVTNYFPSGVDLGAKISPFLLFDYHAPFTYAPLANGQRGVGVHPHRGFETVTLAFEGSVAHHDSTGNSGVIGPGDVQWMTAGSGILHKEYHEAAFARTGGTMHMAQIWVNLPRVHKMETPHYQPILSAEMGLVELPAGAGEVRVIAGDYRGVRGPAKTFTPIRMFDVRLRPQGRLDLSFSPHENTGLVVLKGEVTVNGQAAVKALDFVLFENRGEDITIDARSETHLLLLNGEPINEPVVQYGPFVMNTQQEIQQAIADFRDGKFGFLAA